MPTTPTAIQQLRVTSMEYALRSFNGTTPTVADLMDRAFEIFSWINNGNQFTHIED